MSIQDLYPAGAFDSDGGDNNHSQYTHDNTFSGPGDIDRSADSETVTGVSTETTNERSRMWNAAARDTETDIPEYGRAFAQAGAGGSVGDDDLINHVYGES